MAPLLTIGASSVTFAALTTVALTNVLAIALASVC